LSAKRKTIPYILDILIHLLSVTLKLQLIFSVTLINDKNRWLRGDEIYFPLRSSFLLCIPEAILNIHFLTLLPFLSSRAFSSSAKNLDFLDLYQVFSTQQ